VPSASSIRHKPSSWDCASIGNVKQRHRKDTTIPAFFRVRHINSQLREIKANMPFSPFCQWDYASSKELIALKENHLDFFPCLEEVKAETVLAPLVDAADALSGARPGARREVLESYVRRLEALEHISNSFSGVEKSFALQAGREVRIIVNPGAVSDGEALLLAREVAKKIESEMTYPGQIKVTVIRETRATEFAR
jgi:hypothetical protein